MSNCGVSIDIKEIAAAVIEVYGSAIANEVARQLKLSDFVRSDKGVANDLLVRGNFDLDTAATKALCARLGGCIDEVVSAAIEHLPTQPKVVGFLIDHTENQLLVKFDTGEPLRISRAELKDWLVPEPEKQLHTNMHQESYGIGVELGDQVLRISALHSLSHEAYGISVTLGEQSFIRG